MRLDEHLHRLAHALAEDCRELGLALAAVEDRLLEARARRHRPAGPQRRLQQRAQRLDLRRELALLEPQVDVPLAPGVEVEPGEDEPPLPAVGEQRQALAAGAEPLQHLARRLAPTADADARLAVDEDGQARRPTRPATGDAA